MPPAGSDERPDPGSDAVPLRSDASDDAPVPPASPLCAPTDFVEPVALDAGALDGADGSGPGLIAVAAAAAGAGAGSRGAVSGDVEPGGESGGAGAGAGMGAGADARGGDVGEGRDR